MKKITLSVVLCVIAGALIMTSIISCEKKEVITRSQETSVKNPKTGGDTEKLIPPRCSVTVLSACCGPIECAPGPLFGFTHYNRIQIVKDANTIASYPATMRYTIYVLGSHVSGNIYNITKVDEFVCSQTSPQYANTLLANTTMYYVRIADLSVPLGAATGTIDITVPQPLAPFFTANGKDGLPCE
jgi:hypothetical protein